MRTFFLVDPNADPQEGGEVYGYEFHIRGQKADIVSRMEYRSWEDEMDVSIERARKVYRDLLDAGWQKCDCLL